MFAKDRIPVDDRLPHAHMSTGFPYGSFFSTSGDR